jgi:hypothetical protein
MAHYRTSPAERARRELALLKGVIGAALTVMFAAGLTGAAQAPGTAGVAALSIAEVEAPTATLTRQGDEVLITGSISHIFDSVTFSGPNRAEKRDRARPMAEAEAVSRDFEGIRTRLAALRGIKAPEVAVVPAVQPAGQPMPPPLVTPAAAPADPDGRIELASISPDLTSEALTAIDAVADGSVPVPRVLDAKLAYARADLPATVFDGKLRDAKGEEVSDKELWCMATAIYFEARGESYRGQVAVGQVVLNRVAHRLYPSTICGVVFQNQNKRNACQFSFACDGIPERVTEKKAWDQANEIAKEVIAGSEYLTEVGHSTHYHATYVYPHWAPRMKKNTKIGMHVFYQFKRGWKFG